MKARILYIDIENMAARGWVWGLYEQNVIHVDHQQHLLCFAYNWVGEKKVHAVSQPDFKEYKKDKHNDYHVVKAARDLLDEADIVIGHNLDQFDVKMINSRIMTHKLTPPTPFKTVDTKKVAKRYGRFLSNKLDDLGQQLQLGKKMKHDGFDLWLGCDAGDMKSWKKMIAYNKQDIKLGVKLYQELLPWVNNHPAMNSLLHRPDACPKCGNNKMIAGVKYTSSKTGVRHQYFRCNSCGGVAKARMAEQLSKEERNKYV